jgi:DNA-binding NarL/FixJ family response regulator
MEPDLTRVAVICDCPLYLRGLAELVSDAPDLRLVAEVRRAGEPAWAPGEVDVVLLDLPRPTQEAVSEISRLRRAGLAVIVIRASEARRDVILAIEAGVGGYLGQQVEEAEMLAAIRTVARGRSYICSALSRVPEESVNITGRERQILKLLAEGRTDREIAARLEISEYTVHSHLDRLRDKTASRRRADLTRFAIARGIVGPSPV